MDLYPSSLCGIWGIDVPADVGALSLQSALCTRGLQNNGTLRPQVILTVTFETVDESSDSSSTDVPLSV